MKTFGIALLALLAVSAAGGLWLAERGVLDLGVLGAWSEDTPSAGPVRVVYQYVDAEGAVRFVDRLEEVPLAQRATAGRIEMAGRPTASRQGARATAGAPRVVMYSSPSCHACDEAKAWFERRGVAYTELDIRSAEAREQLRGRVSWQATPTIDVDGQLVIGFDPGRLEELLGS
jgi:glutaredoxin